LILLHGDEQGNVQKWSVGSDFFLVGGFLFSENRLQPSADDLQSSAGHLKSSAGHRKLLAGHLPFLNGHRKL
jgi:hypothetical protein